MYDHLPPRLAKYLAAIYTGTDVPEIERQDVRSRVDEFANIWRSYKKLERWNKQRGQTINQLNQRIHEQRLKICELDRRLTFEKRHANALFSFEEFWQQNFFKVNKWNNAHKREIRELQYKLHRRRVEVTELKEKIQKLNKFTAFGSRVNREFDVALRKRNEELADWYEYVQLLIEKLNEKEKQLKLSNYEVGVGKALLQKAQCNYYSALDKYIDTREKLLEIECKKERYGLNEQLDD